MPRRNPQEYEYEEAIEMEAYPSEPPEPDFVTVSQDRSRRNCRDVDLRNEETIMRLVKATAECMHRVVTTDGATMDLRSIPDKDKITIKSMRLIYIYPFYHISCEKPGCEHTSSLYDPRIRKFACCLDHMGSILRDEIEPKKKKKLQDIISPARVYGQYRSNQEPTYEWAENVLRSNFTSQTATATAQVSQGQPAVSSFEVDYEMFNEGLERYRTLRAERERLSQRGDSEQSSPE